MPSAARISIDSPFRTFSIVSRRVWILSFDCHDISRFCDLYDSIIAAELAKDASNSILTMFRMNRDCLYHGNGGGWIGVDDLASPAPTTRGKGVTDANCLLQYLEGFNIIPPSVHWK